MQAPLSVDNVCKILAKSRADLVQMFGVTEAAISQWRKKGFPAGRAFELERLTEGRVKAADVKIADTMPRGPRRKAAA